MASLPVVTGLPPDLDLDGGYTLTWAAVDPVDGSAVTGVTVSEATIFAANLAATTEGLDFGPFMLVPGPGA